MHAQIRSVPALSPADLRAFLKVLRDNGIRPVAIGGSDIEHGGEFAFSLEHVDGDESEYDRAEQVLQDAGYHPRRVNVQVFSRPVANAQSDVLGALEEAIAANDNTDFRIRDFAVGVDENGKLNLQIVSEPLG